MRTVRDQRMSERNIAITDVVHQPLPASLSCLSSNVLFDFKQKKEKKVSGVYFFRLSYHSLFFSSERATS